jgi:hypothetical protein
MAAGLAGGVATFFLQLLVLNAAVMGAEFIAAIAGAVVGGVIALLVQLVALNAAAKERLEKQAALGRSLLFKVVSIHSNLHHLARHINEGYRVAGERKCEPWQSILPILNLPDRVIFTPEEMSMLMAQDDNNLFNTLLSMDSIHNSTLAIFSEYAKRREELQAQVSVQKMVGNVGTIVLSEEERRRLGPLMFELNDLLDGLKGRSRRDADEGYAALQALSSLLRSELGLKLRISLPGQTPAPA